MEIPSLSECTWGRDHPVGKKMWYLLIWASVVPVMHVGWGNQCADLDVMTCLCCKFLECDHAWPVKLACGQCTCALLTGLSRSLARSCVMSQRSGWSPDVSCCPAKLHCQSASLHGNLIWSDSVNTTQHAVPCRWCITHITCAETCQIHLSLMLNVSFFLFLLNSTHKCVVLLNDLTFHLALNCCLLLAWS